MSRSEKDEKKSNVFPITTCQKKTSAYLLLMLLPPPFLIDYAGHLLAFPTLREAVSRTNTPPWTPVCPSSLASHIIALHVDGKGALWYFLNLHPSTTVFYYKINSVFSLELFFLRSKMYFICVRLDFSGGLCKQVVKPRLFFGFFTFPNSDF